MELIKICYFYSYFKPCWVWWTDLSEK